MRIVVTGSQGQVARALAERGPLSGVDVLCLGRPGFDLTEPAVVGPVLERAEGDVIVNAAAYTAVDKAESEPELAMRTNGVGPGLVAQAAARLKTPLVHLSTDYVFDGTLDRPYAEGDSTGPTSAYGASKLAGEQAIAAAGPVHAILRTAWVYSPFGHNFLKTMLRLGETRGEVSVVNDQRGTPTYALDIADAVIAVAKRLARTPDDSTLHGIFHLAGTGEATWAEFAEAIFEDAARLGRPDVHVKRISTADYPTPARRPANSRLDTSKLAQAYGVVLPHWRVSTRACVARVLSET